jgi:hypothetical protein
MLLLQPQDHKRIIYQNLNIQDLCSLKQVCRSTKNDPILKDVLIQKTVDSYFYFDNEEQFKIRSSPYPFLCSYEYFVQRFYEKISTLRFSDLSCFSLDPATIVLFSNDIQYEPIPNEPLKNKIIDGLVQYLYDIWSYKEQNNPLIKVYAMNVDYDLLIKSIIQYLCQIFVRENDKVRMKIFDKLVELKLNTCKGKKYDQKNNGYVYDDFGSVVETNEFQISRFVESLSFISNRNFPTLCEIISIGSFIESYSFENIKHKDLNVLLLYSYLREIFDRFLDINDLDEQKYSLVDQVIPRFNIFASYNSHQNYGQKLMELFITANYTIEYEFMSAYRLRFKRFYGYEPYQMLTN